ncbi:hypothetical protein ACFQMF_12820 [Halorubrum rutilum]|uniref:Glycerophosphodiester phosphodiesterase n=1 Tax=Halorubrum rutilum TaxID=1364933 RepID=A0ABD6AME1_9EURY|nr:hypothetical protein [Halorubrum rutilum]
MTDRTDRTDSAPILIAHRGFAGENPENTVPAVERAAGVARGEDPTAGTERRVPAAGRRAD